MSAWIASVPGKLILMGEHAAVYGRPALVAALGLRAAVCARRLEGDCVKLALDDLGHFETLRWDDVRELAERASEAWERWHAAPDEAPFPAPARSDPARLVKLALGELARREPRLPGLELEIRSDIPIGAGFGSSAAVAVGVLAAAGSALGDPDQAADSERLERLAVEVERRMHGTPSGVDHRTVLAGGVLEFQRRDEKLTAAPLAVAPAVLRRLRAFDTGPPAESTGEVVAAVRRLRDADPERFDGLLTRAAHSVAELAREAAAEAPDLEAIAALIGGYQRLLEAFGVVPQPVVEVVRRLEAAGLAAKISGAGSLGGGCAGCLLVFDPRRGRQPVEVPDEGRLREVHAGLGVPGLRVGEVA